MTQAELLKELSAKTGVKQTDLKQVLISLASIALEELKSNGKFEVPALGIISTEQRAARKGRNPQTGAEIDIAAKKVVKFKATKGIREAIA